MAAKTEKIGPLTVNCSSWRPPGNGGTSLTQRDQLNIRDRNNMTASRRSSRCGMSRLYAPCPLILLVSFLSTHAQAKPQGLESVLESTQLPSLDMVTADSRAIPVVATSASSSTLASPQLATSVSSSSLVISSLATSTESILSAIDSVTKSETTANLIVSESVTEDAAMTTVASSYAAMTTVASSYTATSTSAVSYQSPAAAISHPSQAVEEMRQGKGLDSSTLRFARSTTEAPEVSRSIQPGSSTVAATASRATADEAEQQEQLLRPFGEKLQQPTLNTKVPTTNNPRSGSGLQKRNFSASISAVVAESSSGGGGGGDQDDEIHSLNNEPITATTSANLPSTSTQSQLPSSSQGDEKPADNALLEGDDKNAQTNLDSLNNDAQRTSSEEPAVISADLSRGARVFRGGFTSSTPSSAASRSPQHSGSSASRSTAEETSAWERSRISVRRTTTAPAAAVAEFAPRSSRRDDGDSDNDKRLSSQQRGRVRLNAVSFRNKSRPTTGATNPLAAVRGDGIVIGGGGAGTNSSGGASAAALRAERVRFKVRRNNSSSNNSSNSLPQVSSLSSAVVPADSLIVTARTTTRELVPNIIDLSPNRTNLSEDVTETLVINLKGSVKKYMEINRNNNATKGNSGLSSSEDISTTSTTTISIISSTKTTTTPTKQSSTTTTGKKLTKKTTAFSTTTTTTESLSSSIKVTKTTTPLPQPTTEEVAKTSPPATTEEVDVRLSNLSADDPREAIGYSQTQLPSLSQSDLAPDSPGSQDQPRSEEENQGDNVEEQKEEQVQRLARPDRPQEEEQDVTGGPVPPPPRPDRLLQAPRQREELKKDLLEAIKRKISKNKPGAGGGDDRIGDHQLAQSPSSSVVFDNQSALQHFRSVELANPIGDLFPLPPLSSGDQDGIGELLSPAANSIAASTNQPPPFFKPIFSHVKQQGPLHHHLPQQQQPPPPQAKVKIFFSLPEAKPGSNIKIPNVSHIQDKLARLNAAITEGLKHQREQEQEQEQEQEEAAEETALAPVNAAPPAANAAPSEAVIAAPAAVNAAPSATVNAAPAATVNTAPAELHGQQIPRSQVEEEVKTIIDELIRGGAAAKSIAAEPVPTLASRTTLSATITTAAFVPKSSTSPPLLATAKTLSEQSTTNGLKKDDTNASAKQTMTTTDNLILSTEHPSSHFRPPPASNNWTTRDEEDEFFPMPKSNLVPKDDSLGISLPQKPLPKRNVNTASTATSANTVDAAGDGTKVEASGGEGSNEVIEEITGTTVYVVAVLAVIPIAGAFAWFARIAIRRKELSSSESNSETGLNRPITEEDSLNIQGRQGFPSLPQLPHTHHTFQTIQEAPENIPKGEGVVGGEVGGVWEFPRSRLRLQTVLGEGNFGKVWKAEADDICGYDGTILVAVKTVKENAGPTDVEDLLLEMNIMKEIGPHPNVVTLLGVSTEQEPFLLIMEYIMYGKLLTHLREQRMKQSSFFNFSKEGSDLGETLTAKDLTKFAYGVAKGMEFLVSKGIIHRDLAARNILVDHNKNCKISDFGLSRNLRDLGGEMYEQKNKGALPIRWMAPESLYFSVFTAKSDVWSFGILMWEIVTLGATPYPGMGAREVMRRVRDGYRLERPAHCHPQLYLIIQRCWAGDMNKRPDFSELRKDLAKLLEDQHGYIDLQNISDAKYYSMDQNPDEEEKL